MPPQSPSQAPWWRAIRSAVELDKVVCPASLLLLTLASCLSLAAGPVEFPALAETDHDAFTYTMARKTHRDFAVRFKLKPDGAFPVRVVFAWTDKDNHDFLHLTVDRMWLGRTEAGLERRVGPPPGAYDAEQELVLRRSQGKATVFAGGRFLMAARGADSREKAAVGYGVTDPGMRLAGFRPQGIEGIHFADDFMSAEEDAVSWKAVSGTWQIETIKNPLRSANAFRFVGSADDSPAVAIAGYAFWHDYTFEVACRPSDTGSIGILLYHGRNGHFRFDWSSGPEGKTRIVRVTGDETEVLAEAKGGYVPEQWYRLSAEVSGRRLKCLVDGHTVADVHDDRLCAGGVGLYVEGGQECSFDDVIVRSVAAFRSDFRDLSLVDWRRLGGEWRVTEPGCLKAVATPSESSPAKLMLGGRSWNSHDVSTTVSLPTAKGAGLCFAYRDEANHYRLEATGSPAGRVVLTRVVAGNAEVVQESGLPADVAAGERIRLRAVVEENVIRACVNGREVLPATWDSSLSPGQAGLCVTAGEAVFAEFATLPLGPFDRSVVGAPRTFSHEKSMANWASAEGEWLAAAGTVDGGELLALWHRADVPGDGGISVRIPQHDPVSDGAGLVKLFYNASPEHPEEGYTVSLSTGAEAPEGKLELRRNGDVLAGGALPAAREGRTLRLQRVGCAISVWVDEQPVLHAYDRGSPPTGLRAGWHADGFSIENDQVSVFSRNVHLDDFRRSPVDWRAPAGIWDVTVRWECDPRWSFFSGRGGMFAASDEKLAAIWHKREFPGDFTIEFTVGQKMAREFGAYADYTRDFNVTVCGDGHDLTSGYTCTFGGWGDTKTAIVRGREVVAETDSVLIPRSNSMHRQWFNVKVRKRASRLSFLVDDETVLEYDDPKPLPGGRVALWTYDNGFMISRFRVSTEEAGPSELPGTARGAPCRSFYDPEP